jgi:hypothetical protein
MIDRRHRSGELIVQLILRMITLVPQTRLSTLPHSATQHCGWRKMKPGLPQLGIARTGVSADTTTRFLSSCILQALAPERPTCVGMSFHFVDSGHGLTSLRCVISSNKSAMWAGTCSAFHSCLFPFFTGRQAISGASTRVPADECSIVQRFPPVPAFLESKGPHDSNGVSCRSLCRPKMAPWRMATLTTNDARPRPGFSRCQVACHL